MKTKLLLLAALFGAATTTAYSQENEISSSGNVGIGTINPTERLDVAGTAKIDSTLRVGDSLVITNSARVGEDLRVSGNTYLSGDLKVEGTAVINNTISGSLTLPTLSENNEVVDILTVDAEGNVTKAHGLTIGTLPYKPFTECFPNNPTPTWSSNINKIYSWCPEIKVGIATNSPRFSLDVRGVGAFTGGLRLGNVLESSFGIPALIEGERTDNSNAPLIRLSVKESSTGISKTRFKVEKDGTIYATQIKVRSTTAIPDYVFKPDYVLMPLSDLKKYVFENSHLPNIPSEKEILENDMNLGDLQLKLLEKVEELTLYILNLKDQSDAQIIENAKLRAEIESLKLK